MRAQINIDVGVITNGDGNQQLIEIAQLVTNDPVKCLWIYEQRLAARFEKTLSEIGAKRLGVRCVTEVVQRVTGHHKIRVQVAPECVVSYDGIANNNDAIRKIMLERFLK